MGKTLYFYNDPNHPLSAALAAQLQASGVAFTERNMATQTRIHSVSRGGPMALIDVDGTAWEEFPASVSSAEISASWNATPDTVPVVLVPLVDAVVKVLPAPLDKPSVNPSTEEIMAALRVIFDKLDSLEDRIK